MKDNELYSKDELKLLEEIESGAYISLDKEAFEKEKAFLIQAAKNTIEKRKKVIKVWKNETQEN